MGILKKKIIIGTWSLTNQFGKIKKTEIEDILDYSIKNNFTEFDTAPNYGNGEIEKILSEFMNNKNSKIKVNTKFGNGRDNIKSFKINDIKKSIDKSIELFGKINTIYIHNPRCSANKIEKIIDILCDYKENKHVKKIGISIARDFYYNRSILNRFDYIQDEINVLFFKNLNFLKSINAKIVARSPLASGCLSGSLNINKKYQKQDYRKDWLKGERLKNILKQIYIIEKIFSKDIRNISKSFVFFNPFLDKIIFGVKKRQHLDELINDIDILEKLDNNKLKELETVSNYNFFLESKGY